MKNVKFRGKKKNSAVNSAAQIPRGKPKFRGSAQNSAARGKLWALIVMHIKKAFLLGNFFHLVCMMLICQQRFLFNDFLRFLFFS